MFTLLSDLLDLLLTIELLAWSVRSPVGRVCLAIFVATLAAVLFAGVSWIAVAVLFMLIVIVYAVDEGRRDGKSFRWTRS